MNIVANTTANMTLLSMHAHRGPDNTGDFLNLILKPSVRYIRYQRDTLDTSGQCITGPVSALGQLSNGLRRIIYEPKVSALSIRDRYLSTN